MARSPRPHEHSYYSKGQWFTPQFYVIGWPEISMLKIGTTDIGRRRYGAFLDRGGDMLALCTLPGVDHLRVEQEVEHEVRQLWAPAFHDRTEATPWLGRRGSGWMECYRIPTPDWHRVLDIMKEKL